MNASVDKWGEAEGPNITIFVGKRRVAFRTSKTALSTSSDFFKVALSNPWNDGTKTEFELPDHRPQVFGLFLSYTEGEKDIMVCIEDLLPDEDKENVAPERGYAIATARVDVPGQPVITSQIGTRKDPDQYLTDIDFLEKPTTEVDTLWDAYILADWLQAVDFQNTAMDAIVAHYKELFEKGKLLFDRDPKKGRAAVPLYNLDQISKIFLPNSPARNFIAELLFTTMSPDIFEYAVDSNIGLISPEVVLDVAGVGFKLRQTLTATYPWDKRGCHYHRHPGFPKDYKCRLDNLLLWEFD